MIPTEASPSSNEFEEWIPIPGFDSYAAGSLGRIARIKTQSGKIIAPRIMKPFGPNKKWKYQSVCLSIASKEKRIFIHDLIARSFLGPRPDGHDIDHVDFNKLNNKPGNLQYVTHSKNQQRAAEKGLLGLGTRKLNPEKIRIIRYMHREGTKNPNLSRLFKISKANIQRIVTRNLWKHVI